MSDVFDPLEAHIRKLIARSGPMPVSRYMELCLTHPELGYYVRKQPIGREGDFITAPEISQMFGELIGLWAASVWNAMGNPEKIQLIELGPGRGTMMMDALRALRILPAFYKALSIHLVEVSPELRDTQRRTIGTSKDIKWYDRLEDVPQEPAIILANEYFDALPIHQVIKNNGAWHERVVEVDDNIFVYGLAKEPMPRFELLIPPHVRSAPDGTIFEWRPDFEIMGLAQRVRDCGGAALIIDYGHLRSDAGDTFQAMAKHGYADPLEAPGHADLTAHVDFAALVRAAEDIGARTHGPVEQGAFLTRLGIEARAQTLTKHSPPDAATDIAVALRRLIKSGPKNMGSLFKVLAITHPDMETVAGIDDHETAAEAGTS